MNQKFSTFSQLASIWKLLSRLRKLQLLALVLLMLCSGIAELVSLGAIVPFLAVLDNPNQIFQNAYVQNLGILLKVSSPEDLLLPITLLFAFTAIFASIVRICNLFFNGKMAALVGSDISCRAYATTLYQPYSSHLQSNSSSLIAKITNHVDRVVRAITAFLQLLTASIVSLGLITALLIISFKLAIFCTVIFGLLYLTFSRSSRKKLTSNSKIISRSSQLQVKVLQEGLGAIRDVIIDNNQQYYVDEYKSRDLPMRIRLAFNQFLGTFPRYAIEGIALVLISTIGYFLVKHSSEGASLLPILGALALGAQRLLPSLQLIYRGWAVVEGCSSDINYVLNILNDEASTYHYYSNVKAQSSQSLVFNKKICFSNVSFNYNRKLPKAVDCLNFTIHKGECVGIIGKTGSGKSTTLDLLMGLLKPTEGYIQVDELVIDKNANENLLNQWRKTISHVPQRIYLSDATITENIAFGVPKEKIDFKRVIHASKLAQIHNYIMSSNQNYDSFVGERGIRLSGGQVQRIGIARALYKNSQLLVLDEATSALDSKTELDVMDCINSLCSSLTVVIVAHRLSTLDKCDKIIDLSL